MHLKGRMWLSEWAHVNCWGNLQLSAMWNADMGATVKKKVLFLLFSLRENWVVQCLLSLIMTWRLLFTSVLWLHCLQPLKDFGRQKRSGLRTSNWYNSQVSRLCGTGFLTPRVNRRIRWGECGSWGGWGERWLSGWFTVLFFSFVIPRCAYSLQRLNAMQ